MAVVPEGTPILTDDEDGWEDDLEYYGDDWGDEDNEEEDVESVA